MTPALSAMSKAGWAACAALALGGTVTAVSCWPALSAAFATSGAASPAPADPKLAEDRYKQALDTQVAAVKGRSLFFTPPRPAPPIDNTPRPERPTQPPPPPPPPARYGGPSIQALVTGAVWFSDGKKALVGETVGSGSSAVTVLAADSPFAVRLKWQDKEWDVAMFDRDGVVFPSKPPEKEPEKPADKPADHAADKPALKPGDKPIDHPAEDPAKAPTPKTPDKPADKPVNNPADKPGEAPSKADDPKDDTTTPAPAPTPKPDDSATDPKVEARP